MAFYSTKEAALNVIGRHIFGHDSLAELLTYASGADTPSNTSTIPAFVGQYYLDTANGIWYKAVATSAATDFKALNS
jgi:hypothetical protein